MRNTNTIIVLMRRLSILLVIAIVFAMIALAPVSAGKPDCSDPETTHPSCNKDDPGDETLYGTVCDPAEYPPGIVGVQYDDFTFELSGKSDSACIDVISVEGPWEVTVTGDGARSLGVIPRDSIGPGDSCGGYLLRSESNIYGSNPLALGYDGVIPAATVNACGVDFAEWVDFDFYNMDESYCSAYNNDETMCEVTEAVVETTHPLVLQTFLRGSADGVTTVHVDLPDVGLP